MNELATQLAGEGRTVYRFGFGQSPFSPPSRVAAALEDAVDRRYYAPVQGLPELRSRVADFHTRTDGYSVDEDLVFIAPGSKVLLFNTLLAFDHAVVAMPQPCWVSYAEQVRLVGHDLRLIPTAFEDRWRIDVDRLDATFSRDAGGAEKILVLNNPGNPDGLAYDERELDAIAGVLRRHDAWVISDEIYGLLNHTGQHVAMAQRYPEKTLTTGGLSKWCGLGGWRLGVQFVSPGAPASFARALRSIAAATYSCAPTPVQHAACTAYIHDETTQRHLECQRVALAAIGRHVFDRVVGRGCRAHLPEGGFYEFLDFSPSRDALAGRGITDDVDLCATLLDDSGVALLPGSAFQMDDQALTARLAFVDFDGDAFLDDLHRGSSVVEDDLVQRHAARLADGVGALADWLGPA